MECSDSGIIDSPPSSKSFDSSDDVDTDRSSFSPSHDSTFDEASLHQFVPIDDVCTSLTRRSTPPPRSDGDPAHSSSAPHPVKYPSTSPYSSFPTADTDRPLSIHHSFKPPNIPLSSLTGEDVSTPLGLNTPQAPLLFFNSPSQKREEGSPVRTPPSFPSTSPPSTDSSKKSTQSMPVGTSALYGTDSPISRVAFENSFRTSLNTPERAESNVTVTDHITPTRDQDDDFFDNGDHITPPRLPLTPTEEPYPHYPTDRDTETIDSLPLAFGTPSHSYTHSVASFNLSLLTMDTFSSLFPTPPTIRIDPPSLPLEETLPGQAPLLPLLTDLRAQFANIPRPSLVPPSIIDSESQDGLLPTPAHKLDLTAPLRLLSSNSIDRGPIPPPAMSPHPSPPPQPKSFFNYRPKPPKPPNRSKSKNTSSLQPLILATVIPEHQKLPSPSPPNPKAVVPHTPPHRSKAKNSSPFRPPLPSTVIFEHPDSPFPSPPKAKSAVPPMPKIHTFRTFIPQSQRQNDSEQTTVIPEHPNSPFPSPPKAKAKERRMPTIRSFRTFIPQSQRQNGTEEVFTIVQCDPVKPHPVSKAKSLPRLPPLPKAKPRRQLPKAASVPPNQEAGRREIHFEASSLNPYQRNYRYAEQSLAAGLQRLFGSTYDPTNIFNYEPLSYLKKRVRLFLLQKNLNLFRYYIRFFYPAPRQSWYIGSVMRIIDRRLRFTWIRNERFPDNVFLDMRKLTPLEERNIRPRSVVVFLIRVNRYPSSYFEAREAFLYQRKIQDTSVLKLPEPPGRW